MKGEKPIEVKTRWGAVLTMTTRTEQEGDAEVIAEVIRGDTYNLAGRTVEPRIALDIGAHIGTFTCALKSKFPNVKVWAFEPNPRSFELLQKNTEHLKDVVCVNAAITYSQGTVLTDGIGATGGGFITTRESFNEAARQKSDADRFIYSILGDVKTMTLEEAIDLTGEDFFDLVKWDCEGGEIDAFRNMGQESAEKIGDMVGEFHIEGGYRVFEEIAQQRFPTHTFNGRPHEIEDKRPIGWFSATRSEAKK